VSLNIKTAHRNKRYTQKTVDKSVYSGDNRHCI
jgi:hypothetical protein